MSQNDSKNDMAGVSDSVKYFMERAEVMRKIVQEQTPTPRRRPDYASLSLWRVPLIHREKLPPRPDTAVRAVDAWMAARATVLLLSGPPGVGKSLAGAHWLSRCLPGEGPLREQQRWWDVREVQMLGRHARREYREVINHELLVLDDLGAEPQDTDAWWLSHVEFLLSQRMEARSRTLITTNLGHKDLRNRYGIRLYDRLRQNAKMVVVSAQSKR